ncbi:sigma 54-interacting transcriptional regulator [Komagataeibacter europaeus]|uniref:sigma 54-interacting transcriptional regulator n=1 Tax=Komagataeibacter europaeus TaxID=33995 RepID=UPI000309FDA6|nr:sigma 54-interacting transcriptional regulator [Komagataeibacter europaeus]
MQKRLLEHFVVGTPARSVAELVGINRNTATLYYRELREIIAEQIAHDAPFSGENEVDESYFGGHAEQGLLLDALESGSYYPVGSDTAQSCRFHLIAATSRDLPTLAQQGIMRPDQLARLALWVFHLPPLRDRREDFEAELAYELEEAERRPLAADRALLEGRPSTTVAVCFVR